MEVINNKALLVRTKYPDRITAAIEKSKVVGHENGVYEVAVKWGLNEAQLLNQFIKGVPSPISKKYDWPGQFNPFSHQKTTSEFLTLNRRAFCFNEQGTGKTASVIWAADYLMKLKLVRRVLVVCPLSIMKSAWQEDLFKFAVHRTCNVAYGTAAQRIKVVNSRSEFIITNFEGVEIIEDAVTNDGNFDLIVVDEANAYKNVSTKRWKIMKRVSDRAKWFWMLTGTPAAQSPVDAYGLAKLVNPDNTPKFLGSFRDQVMQKITQFKWTPRPNAENIVHKLLQPAIRFEKKDCIDLPDLMYVEREAPLTSQQRKYYKILKDQMMISADGEDVTSVNAATNLNKLLQISGGAVYTDTKEIIEFDVSNRLQVIKEVIEEASHKVLVFVPFTHTIELLQKHLNKTGVTSDVINGAVSVNRRAVIIKNFQEQPNPRVLIIQPQAASHGLTLTAANVIVWYAPVTSVETYLQANARINRPGQKNTMTIVHIAGSPVERKLYTMLRNNISTHSRIVDLYSQELKET
ncbi:DEAD/DEAH box helicase [bacterium]|nr:DEAD/DEAH box helicase [bacterium]